MSRKPQNEIILIATSAVAGESKEFWNNFGTFEASGHTTAGGGTAEIVIEVRNDVNSAWLIMGTITLTLTTAESGDGFVTLAPWKFTRARVTSISGTGATVTVSAAFLA